MQSSFPFSNLSAEELLQQRTRVMRSTYILLALTLIPTVIGALIAEKIGFRLFARGGWLLYLTYSWITFGLVFLIEWARDSVLGIFLLFVFTFIEGFLLPGMLHYALGYANGGTLIALAAGGTAVIFFVMAAIARVTKRDFSFLERALTTWLLLIILAIFMNLVLNIPTLWVLIAGAVIFVGSLFILSTISGIVNGGETDYVNATLALYVSLLSIFSYLLLALKVLLGKRE